MSMHKEGKKVLPAAAIMLAAINLVFFLIIGFHSPLFKMLATGSLILLGMMTWFFRNPHRSIVNQPGKVFAGADGDIVEIERLIEKEYFRDERIQISTFMSIFNVHINRIPVAGEIVFQKHTKGKFFPAFIVRSSEENERCSTVIRLDNGQEIMIRQIAGIVARRIRTYKKPGDKVTQMDQLGFIRFGSRVDIFLPVSSRVEVKLHQKSIGGQTVIATLSDTDQ